IVDKAPVGVHGELRAVLEACARPESRCRVVLSLRDILDSPEEVSRHFQREGTFDALRRFYDMILVWGEQRVFDLVREYDLPDDIAEQVHYCGYIAPPPAASEAPRPRKRKRIVLVTVGGGEDGNDLLESYLAALPRIRRRFASVVLTGPDLPPEDRDALQEQVENCDRPIFLVPYSRHVDRLVRAADLVVAMGGYNTLCEIVARGRPAIVVPRINPRQEQLIRAQRWSELGLVTMIHPEELTPERLAGAIEEQLHRPKLPPADGLDFDGLARAARLLLPENGNGNGSAGSPGTTVSPGTTATPNTTAIPGAPAPVSSPATPAEFGGTA
ncbi:MAG: hypothetical protein HKN12_05270, partial [Gemmatimonadetes bacterium]|nr:hypothetical protein [Gemmatimonadota bacterium]